MLAITRIALRRPYTFIVMAILMAIFGVIAWRKTPVDIFPNIGIPVVAVVWSYGGESPQDMSERIVYYYERALSATVNDIEHIESQSLQNYGIVKIFFQPGVDINGALAQVTATSQTVLKYLPAGITPPFVLSFNASSVPVLQLALSSKSLDQALIFDEGQNFIRPQLSSVAGAAIPSPYGGKVLQVQVDLDQNKLQAYGLSAQEVVKTIAAQNIVTPVGDAFIGKGEYIVNLNGSPDDVAQINNIPLKVARGGTVFLRDVAFAHSGAPPQSNMVHVNGDNAVLMTILKAGSVSTLDVINGVKSLLPRLRETLPKGLRLDAVGDQSVFVQSAVNSVIREGLIAASLTGMMILIFLGSWRSTLIVTTSIPLSILTAIALLSVTGQTINVMTLGGLALAVGILVDDATVTIENINRHLEMGKDIEIAIMDGARQIIVPATVSVTCIMIAFVPMFSLGGVAGFLFRPLAMAVLFALGSSYVVSSTLVSTMARFLLAAQAHHHHAEGADAPPTRNPFVKFQLAFERRFEALRSFYLRMLTTALAGRYRFIAGFMIVSVSSIVLVPFLGENFFPSVPSTELKLHVRAPTGSRIEETAAICNKVEIAIRKALPQGAVKSIVDNIGQPISGINLAYGNSGTVDFSDADLLITLNDGEIDSSETYIKNLREILPRQFPGSTFAFLPADIVSQILNFGLPSPIDVQVIGPSFKDNLRYANELLRHVARVPGIADPRIQQSNTYPQMNVNVDRTFAAQISMDEYDVAKSLQNTLSGSFAVAPTFWINPKNSVAYPVIAQSPEYAMNSMSALGGVSIAKKHSSQVVAGLGDIKRGVTASVVSHYNVEPVVDIFASTTGRDLGAVSSDISKIIADTAKDRPRGGTVVLRGQTSTMTAAYRQLLTGIAMADVLIYLLIVVNFQSWLDPFVIITALPTALAGIVWMLFITGTTLSVPALTGAIMCMGVATANSILVISFARERLAEGDDPLTAALAAGHTRFRPVMMTALAMVIGMGPMALSAEQNAPLGRAVIGGLICATIATLLFVPAVFRLVHERGHGKAHTDPDSEPNHEAAPI